MSYNALHYMTTYSVNKRIHAMQYKFSVYSDRLNSTQLVELRVESLATNKA